MGCVLTRINPCNVVSANRVVTELVINYQFCHQVWRTYCNWAVFKTPYAIPLYWLVLKDPYNGLSKSLYIYITGQYSPPIWKQTTWLLKIARMTWVVVGLIRAYTTRLYLGISRSHENNHSKPTKGHDIWHQPKQCTIFWCKYLRSYHSFALFDPFLDLKVATSDLRAWFNS